MRFSNRLLSVLCMVGLAGASFSPRTVSAQSGNDSGWFENADAGSAAPASSSPVTPSQSPAPAAGQQSMQSIPASPLLEDDAQEAADRDPRALHAWNEELAPYGSWVDDPVYGRVWIPDAQRVGTGFAPYSSNGRWVLDENEQWVWVSDYPFGNVVFHYGRWVWISGRGWAWIPGLRYAPAWVAWRTPVAGYAYVGWAPLPPTYVWLGGVAVVYGYSPVYPWVFCPSGYVFSYHVHRYILHDHHRIVHAARVTRPYTPARPRAGGYVRAAPRSPSLSAARVPARAIPKTRVSSREIAARTNAVPRSDRIERRSYVQRTPSGGLDRRDVPARKDGAEQRARPAVPSAGAERRERLTVPRSEAARRPDFVRPERPSFERRSPSRGAPRAPERAPLRSPGGTRRGR